MKERYYLSVAGSDYQEVTQEQFIRAEEGAGFHPKKGCGPVATAGFSGNSISGKIEYEKIDTLFFSDSSVNPVGSDSRKTPNSKSSEGS